MTKFLNQKCKLERYLTEFDDTPKLNSFGEIQYGVPSTVKCRHENISKDVQTPNGNIVRSVSRYYFDNTVQIRTDYRVDGKVVIDVETYVNLAGIIEGYEVYV